MGIKSIVPGGKTAKEARQMKDFHRLKFYKFNEVKYVEDGRTMVYHIFNIYNRTSSYSWPLVLTQSEYERLGLPGTVTAGQIEELYNKLPR